MSVRAGSGTATRRRLRARPVAAAFVVSTNLFLRPLIQLINKQPFGAAEIETQYAVEIRCDGREEAHVRAVLLQEAVSASLGLRRLTSENLEDSPQVTVSALLVSPSRHDAALEQIVGRMSLEPFGPAVHWLPSKPPPKAERIGVIRSIRRFCNRLPQQTQVLPPKT